jgi:hypothetical protein
MGGGNAVNLRNKYFMVKLIMFFAFGLEYIRVLKVPT